MISVVVCTNREAFIPNILENFSRQTFEEKELIVILNSSLINASAPDLNVRFVTLPETMSLGECLNQGVKLATYDYVAKMDDDDFYGADYLEEAYEGLLATNADLVGKSTFYIYFQKNHELRLYNANWEKRWIPKTEKYKTNYFMSGATLVFRKEVMANILFPHVNVGEDSHFQQVCFRQGLKMFSLSKSHYAYIRYPSPRHHHSDVKEHLLRRRSKFVANLTSIESLNKL
ncbi:glycosyltransferase family 2 protein [Neobacillus notoginsengisoli]|uniref:Glycosyltransferase family 2 protein n=1 Tax=Neobacillus notoginsengisoli TaxID=1578198 RepID=A0A417Z0Q8_9BACI|nr:glycosyltransferase family 2 protein [Neobacillus notoginsengisoli]RHW43576.1 glycosyltransferase family 2 protein [Neobacillus notoginsengisoli]